MALLTIHLVKDHGLHNLFATTILTGILQILWCPQVVAKCYVPRAVMIGQ